MKPTEHTLGVHQLFIVAVLQYLAFADNKNAVGSPNRTQPMRDNKHRAVFKEFIKRLLYLMLGFHVQR